MPLLPQGPPMGGGLAMPPPPMGGMPPPPVPAEQAGMAAMSLVPQQQAAAAALNAAQVQETQQTLIGALAAQFAGAPNPAAEAAQGMPAQMVAPGQGGAPVGDPNDPFGGA